MPRRYRRSLRSLRGREANFAGRHREEEVENLLLFLVQRHQVAWFVRSRQLDRIGIDFLVGLIRGKQKRIACVDVSRGSYTSILNKRRAHKKWGGKRVIFVPNLVGNMQERADRLLKFLQNNCRSEEELASDWQKFCGESGPEPIRKEYGSVWNFFLFISDQADEVLRRELSAELIARVS